MKLVIVSGRSGSGKSIALKALEDSGFYCIDNLPLTLAHNVISDHMLKSEDIAISVDARNLHDLEHFPEEILKIKALQPNAKIIFIDAEAHILLKRFSETRRRHPLTSKGLSLKDAVRQEKDLLAPVLASADLVINTSELTPHDLRERIRERVIGTDALKMDIQLVSFGFKHGTPKDADFVFDVRCLPNPYWVPELRELSGKDEAIVKYLEQSQQVMEYLWQLKVFLTTWIPEFSKQDRSYLTCAIGCTGGRHRSVYIVETLAKHLKQIYPTIQLQHREMNK